MPEISSVFVLPAAPAAPNAASPAAASASATGTQAAPDKGGADFLSQFKAAIKNLASVALPQVAPPVVAALVVQMDAKVAATDAPPTDTKNTDAEQSDLMPEILAALGFVVVPPVLQTPVAAVQPSGGAASPAAAVNNAASPVVSQQSQPLPQAAQPLQVPQSAQEPQSPQSPPTLPAAPIAQSQPAQPVQTSAPLAAQSLQAAQVSPPSAEKPAAAVVSPLLDQLQAIPAQPLNASQQQPLNSALQQSLNAAQQQLLTAAARTTAPQRQVPTTAPKTDSVTVTPAVTPQVTPIAAAAVTVAPQAAAAVALDAPVAQHPASAPVADSAAPIAPSQPAGTFQQSGFDSSSQQPHSTPVVESASATTAADVAPNATFAAAVNTTAPASVPVPADIQPAQVVSQIAHQAELYRVPGDRSVHIQLQPEGLGGVDVTLRYSVATGIQLHMNVEHAATGALVQAGWTDLRDALATQGIYTDRLVMSISAPANASGLDFSNGNGSQRSDSGLASFTQGQTSQQRQETQDQRATRGWNGGIDPILPSSNDTTPRVAPAGAGHIDYRV